MKPKTGIAVPQQVRLALKDVNLAPYNPRTISAEKMTALKASLVKHGFVLNLVVQKKGMVLIGGHQRVRAMRELCKEHAWTEPTELPATVLDVDDATAKQLNIALNNVEGEFDPYKLGELFVELRPVMTGEDVVATGFEEENIAELMSLLQAPDEAAAAADAEAGEIGGFGNSVTLSIEFANVEERDAAKVLLKAASASTGKSPATILMQALRAAKASGRHASNGKVVPLKKRSARA